MSDDLDTLLAIRGSLQSALVHVSHLIEKLSTPAEEPSPKPKPKPPLQVADQASEDPTKCLHPFLIDLPKATKMCQSCGAQKIDGGEWQW